MGRRWFLSHRYMCQWFVYCVLVGVICVVPSLKGISIESFTMDSMWDTDRFDFIDVNPRVQLLNNPCVFTCIAYPTWDISSVELVVTTPNGTVTRIIMEYCAKGKYVYETSFHQIGKYYFFINLETFSEGLFQSSLYSFWISYSYADTDADRLPDSWESRYGFNTEDASTPWVDSDGDGYTNMEEYEMDTNPRDHNVLEHVWWRLREKQTYLIISFFLFCVLFLFSWVGMRRETL